jgi:hypothetical protein
MYDYFLGGKDNFAADREAADLSAQAVPQIPWLARQNRKFLGRATRYCAEAGIRQFLDIGSGLPTMDNVHQVARRVSPDARVAYMDNDPVVVSHARALLADRDTIAVRGDVREPAAILADPKVRGLIDFSQPVAVLLIALLHFVPDDADPAGCVATLRDALVPGSYMVISHVEISLEHAVGEQVVSETARQLAEARKGTPALPARTRAEITPFFDGMTLVHPGLVDVWDWRPDSDNVEFTSEVMTVLGGVARV